MLQLTTDQLKQKIENKENFILDLYATWCGPCKIMLYNLTKLDEMMANETVNKPDFSIYKFDIDTDKEYVVNQLGIRSVPTIKIFKQGQEVFSKPGVMTATEVLDLISNKI